ncbi:MAG: GNAT family N-acetyltransferase [Bacteroidia bacterium]|jgi:RimJ/RimL family protein N-acetyltransferase|nr:GNAT family N-acetyltransferase [Bacteroidia bacterium]
MKLSTARLQFRELTEDDAPFMHRLMNSPGWLQFIGNRNIATHDDAAAYLRTVYIPHYARHGFGFYLASSVADDEPLGICGLIKREGLDHVDIGFAFLPEHCGKGYATEGAAAIMTFARNLGLSTLVAITTPDNAASIAVLQKIGFTQQKTIELNGEVLLLHTQ